MKHLQEIFEKAKNDIPKAGVFFVSSRMASKKQTQFINNINFSFLQHWKLALKDTTFKNTLLSCINDPDSLIYGISETLLTEEDFYKACIFEFCKITWWYAAHLTNTNVARNIPPVNYIFKK